MVVIGLRNGREQLNGVFVPQLHGISVIAEGLGSLADGVRGP